MMDSRVTRGLLAAASLGLVAACAAPAALTGEAQPATSRQVFLAKCSRCHPPEKAYRSIDTRETWIKQVASMAAKDFRWIDTAAMKIIIGYADDHPAAAKATFARKCGACHKWESLRELEKNPGQWKTMLTFMGQRSPEGLSQEEGEMLWRALAAR